MPVLIAVVLCCSIPLLVGLVLWPWRKLGSRNKHGNASTRKKEDTNG